MLTFFNGKEILHEQVAIEELTIMDAEFTSLAFARGQDFHAVPGLNFGPTRTNRMCLKDSKAHFCCLAKNAPHSAMALLLLPCRLLIRVLSIKVVLIER